MVPAKQALNRGASRPDSNLREDGRNQKVRFSQPQFICYPSTSKGSTISIVTLDIIPIPTPSDDDLFRFESALHCQERLTSLAALFPFKMV
ncbi:hypothetical protein PGT21_001266 [Puccinia graminis f. sp. tritici]|uniref:Uncharacterized protein n=1 Tax=Puccinia graminis f. sp. tritici TaxID=56615 RepID=A0A5B0MZN5_PUCGR|nr:hypothetical protein PGT21_001266 [Puccinia graminis f. sp. tritici]